MNSRFYKFDQCRMLVLIVSLLLGASVCADEPAPHIAVSGTAKIMVTPDQALIQAAVVSRFPTLDEAVADNRQSIERVVGFLREAGVDGAHIQTSRITIQPIWPERDRSVRPLAPVAELPPMNERDEFKKNLAIGYEASRQFQIKIVDLKKFEEIYSGLLKSGVNSVSSVMFTTTELRKHRDEARIQAVRAAREKATAMAGELDAVLRGVKSIREGADVSYMPFAQNSFAETRSPEDADGMLAPGQIEISARVQVEFYLLNQFRE